MVEIIGYLSVCILPGFIALEVGALWTMVIAFKRWSIFALLCVFPLVAIIYSLIDLKNTKGPRIFMGTGITLYVIGLIGLSYS